VGFASDIIELVAKGRACKNGCFRGVQSWYNGRDSVGTGLKFPSEKGMVMIAEKATIVTGF